MKTKKQVPGCPAPIEPEREGAFRKRTIGAGKILFTPGPLTTSQTVKQAMLRDLGSRDVEFIRLVKDIRHKLIELGQADPDEYTTVLMQGSGTFGLEAVISSTIPPDGKLLVIINGAYGNLDEEQAATFAAKSRAKQVIPTHFGLFVEHGGCPRRFGELLKKISPQSELIVLTPGRGAVL